MEGKIAVMMTLLILSFGSSIPAMTVVHAAGAGGSFTGFQSPAKMLSSNGTAIVKGQFTWSGILSGTSNFTEYGSSVLSVENPGAFHGVEVFTGVFDGSKSGSMTSQFFGNYTGDGAFQGTEFWNRGTSGLTGLQLRTEWGGEVAACSATSTSCPFSGTYTLTSANWELTPLPEFSNLTLLVILVFTSITSSTMLKRKKTS